jgi:hypothetical protein
MLCCVDIWGRARGNGAELTPRDDVFPTLPRECPVRVGLTMPEDMTLLLTLNQLLRIRGLRSATKRLSPPSTCSISRHNLPIGNLNSTFYCSDLGPRYLYILLKSEGLRFDGFDAKIRDRCLICLRLER